jgi:hypothetical protein
MRYKGIRKAIERLMAGQNLDSYQITMRDGTTAWLTFRQITSGCGDCLAGVRSFEGVVMSNAATSNSEYGRKAIDLLNACRG